jgi:hypothetical protein
LNAHEREIYRLELLRIVRLRRKSFRRVGCQPKRSLAHALGVDHLIIWRDGY